MMPLEQKEPLEANPRVYSPETLARLEAITQTLKAHKKAIAYLKAVANGEMNLQKTGCTRAIRRYQRTKTDEARLTKTLQNLHRQIELLNYEREVLKRYGC